MSLEDLLPNTFNDIPAGDQDLIKSADKLDDSPIEWLIPNWIPKRGITLLGSDGGVGKTFVWVSLLASISKGENTFLCSNTEPVSNHTVLCFSGEDPENILRQRFEQAGADLHNIRVVAQDTKQDQITFDDTLIHEAMERYKPSIIVFDPLQAFLASTIDMSRRNHMRKATQPISYLASEYDCAVIIVMHTNKRSGEYGRNKLADSADLWDIARQVLMCGFTKDKDRYISVEKSNFGDKDSVQSVMFNLDGGRVNIVGYSNNKMSDFESEKTNNQNGQPKRPTKKQKCADAILEILRNEGGHFDSTELTERLQDDFSGKTIEKAKSQLKNAGFTDYQKQSSGKTIITLTGITEPEDLFSSGENMGI
ncbi:MAG: AAA family ATPase [Solobacterium sp.]|nr:AAA family ATPase [Solobacterium sp.]